MKLLKPSHRENKRYLLISGKDADFEILENLILEFIGVLGLAKSSLQNIKKTNKGLIVAINRESLNEIRTSILLSEKGLKIIKVSGCLNKLK